MTTKATTHPARTKMNKTEQAWADQLELAKRAGDVLDYKFEAVKLRLADNTFYTPDFFVVLADTTIRVDEVKGFWRDDARVKIKVAAEQFPWLRFQAVSRKKKQWRTEQF